MAEKFESFVSPTGTVYGRLLPGADLMPSLIAAANRHGMVQGYIASLIGSLSDTSFVYVRPAPDTPMGIRYGDPLSIPGPVEILGASGMLGLDDAGTATMHIHALFVDVMGRIHGGHVLETGNPTAVTVEFALEPINGGQLVRRVDPKLGFPVFTFSPEEA